MQSGGPVTIITNDGSSESVRSLYSWLRDGNEFRDAVDLIQRPLGDEYLGGLADAVTVAVRTAGGIPALLGAVLSWLRIRSSDVELTITRPNGATLALAAQRVKGLDLTDLTELIEQAARTLDGPSETDDRTP